MGLSVQLIKLPFVQRTSKASAAVDERGRLLIGSRLSTSNGLSYVVSGQVLDRCVDQQLVSAATPEIVRDKRPTAFLILKAPIPFD